MNAGALTFSVTLMGMAGERVSRYVLVLHAAWALLFVALLSCLGRFLAFQQYRYSDVAAKRAESEIDFIDADSQLVSSRPVDYSDSLEPYDLQRELQIHKANREKWQQVVDDEGKRSKKSWQMVRVLEWVVWIPMFFGFLLLVTFAVMTSIG